MTQPRRHAERHLISRIGWLRAAVLGANDGIISTASLIVGVAGAAGPKSQILIAGIAGLLAGSMAMAAGEYVSVSSQADTEKADLAREQRELAANPAAEQEELAQIYIKRGVDRDTAIKVASQLMANDALGAHAQDELGVFQTAAARPIQAGITSAITFSCGAAAPLLLAFLTPTPWLVMFETVGALLFLGVLGAIGAIGGGANVWRATARVTFWGALAMGVTFGIGRLIGHVV